jgi:hypothetical protein
MMFHRRLSSAGSRKSLDNLCVIWQELEGIQDQYTFAFVIESLLDFLQIFRLVLAWSLLGKVLLIHTEMKQY